MSKKPEPEQYYDSQKIVDYYHETHPEEPEIDITVFTGEDNEYTQDSLMWFSLEGKDKTTLTPFEKWVIEEFGECFELRIWW